MTKFGHVHTKHFFLPSIVLDDVIARAVALRDSVVHYQTIGQDQQPHWLTTGGCTAWYFTLLLSLTSSEHDMSCILMMISCCSLTLRMCQSRLVSVPGLCLQSSTTASTCLLNLFASRICRQWVGQHTHTHSHQNG